MKKKAKIFSPDVIQTRICQAVRRDIALQTHVSGDSDDPLEMLRYRQATEIDKKYVSVTDLDSSREEKALKKFLSTNEHMSQFGIEGLNLPGKEMRYPQSRFSTQHNVLLRARAIMRSVLTPFDDDEWFHATKHGTGTSVGVSFMDTSLEAKSTLPLSVTLRAASILDDYLLFDRKLKSAIISFNDSSPFGEWYEIVSGSRAATVPKNSDINRMIAVEPTGNMFLQQGLMAMMYVRMKRVGLDLAILPTLHKERAKIASITSNEATIDWSSASDCVSIELLRWLLPPKWFECCDRVRSTSMSIDKESVALNMFSTMGNAVTFPLETLVFWTLAQATRLQSLNTLSHFPEWKDRHLCSVFGDDCIVPSSIALDFIQVMENVGFIVNEEKSFYGDERFRESCGGDYLRGYDVRPFFMKAPTSDRLSALEPWLYIIGNRLIPKYMSCFGKRNYVYDKDFWNAYFDLFRQYNLKLKVVPMDFPDDAGLKISFDLERFAANHGLADILAKPRVSEHGMVSFLFLRFNYQQNEKPFQDLRYCLWLKRHKQDYRPGPWYWDDEYNSDIKIQKKRQNKAFRRFTFRQNLQRCKHLSMSPEVKPLFREERKRGGYVVARGYTVHWTVPQLSRRQM